MLYLRGSKLQLSESKSAFLWQHCNQVTLSMTLIVLMSFLDDQVLWDV
jgi:hypothetical protein